MKLTTLLVCDAGLDKRQTIEDLIHSQPSLALVSTVSGSMAREQIGSLHPKLVWIELSPAPVRGLSLLAELRETFPQLYFFVSYEVPDPELIRTAYRLGASDFLDAERWRTDLPAAVQSIQLKHQSESVSTAAGKVIAIFSPTGGIGATTLCTNIAGYLGKYGEACIVDLDLQFGMISHYLNLEPSFNLDSNPSDIPCGAKYGISTGQIVSQHDLAPQGISLGFESRLKEGMRAITFGVDNNSGVAGFVAPESHVDILAMVGSGADVKARPVLSDVEVIAIGTIYQKTPGATTAQPTGSVTVTLTPEDAEKLIKAMVAAKLYLTLRNDKDHTPVATVDVASLFPKAAAKSADLASLPPPSALPPPPLPGGPGGPDAGLPGAMNAAPPPPPPLHEIEIWSGSKKDVLSVPKG